MGSPTFVPAASSWSDHDLQAIAAHAQVSIDVAWGLVVAFVAVFAVVYVALN